MALTTALTLQGVDEDKVVECDNVGEAVQALQQAQANPGAPLMLVLAQERWSEMIGDLGSLSRMPDLLLHFSERHPWKISERDGVGDFAALRHSLRFGSPWHSSIVL
mmetsp:Transcript_55044/g.178237  ORF Transcript_55044/g.178237 Transcript_55044/m.178237 type:complete len:107 (-) Transcript_55044:266-586(-)